uniref:lipopolysaccharide biosynthesis protein n=1 Tax=Acetatifactor sp. TaxID=1872090 RepID=UPI004057826E
MNGLVNSITQFLSAISFLELGVGAVVQSSLYKPLVQKDNDMVSKIITSASKFFKRLAIILLIYIVILLFTYPFVVVHDFEYLYTATLIIVMGISSFAQYYFGVVDRLLLTADQRGYIQYTAQTITLIVNTIACSILIYFGCSIHVVRLTTSLIFLLSPIALRWYVNRHYSVNRKMSYDVEPIAQKWNGVAQHVAAVILDGTDTIVLTLFASLSDVSIYATYNMVVMGVRQLLTACTSGISAYIGNLLAKEDMSEVHHSFGWIEWCFHTATVLIFGCCGVLLVPFIRVYTIGIDDINYIQLLFAILITLAQGIRCLRIPHNILILASGHYKQTQNSYINTALLNILISVITVKQWGLVGVAIGTLVAMIYQTMWMAIYDTKHLLRRPISIFAKQILIDLGTVLVGVFATYSITMSSVTYSAWVIMGIKVFIIWLTVVLIINFIFFRERVLKLSNYIRKKLH